MTPREALIEALEVERQDTTFWREGEWTSPVRRHQQREVDREADYARRVVALLAACGSGLWTQVVDEGVDVVGDFKNTEIPSQLGNPATLARQLPTSKAG